MSKAAGILSSPWRNYYSHCKDQKTKVTETLIVPVQHSPKKTRRGQNLIMTLNLCIILQATWHSYFNIFGDSSMELSTSGTFNFRLITNQLCQTTHLHLKIIFPSGTNHNTAAAKMCTLVENTHVPKVSFSHYHLCLPLQFPHPNCL